MPEWDTQPANQYLPRKVTASVTRGDETFDVMDFVGGAARAQARPGAPDREVA
jgi:hypothetical protein